MLDLREAAIVLGTYKAGKKGQLIASICDSVVLMISC